MTGAVVVVETGGPQRRPGEGIELAAGRAAWKTRRAERDMALQHAREAIAHLRRGAPMATVQDVAVVETLGTGIDDKARPTE